MSQHVRRVYCNLNVLLYRSICHKLSKISSGTGPLVPLLLFALSILVSPTSIKPNQKAKVQKAADPFIGHNVN